MKKIKNLMIGVFNQEHFEIKEMDKMIDAVNILKQGFEKKQSRFWIWIRNFVIFWKIDLIRSLFDEIFKLKKNIKNQFLQTRSFSNIGRFVVVFEPE